MNRFCAACDSSPHGVVMVTEYYYHMTVSWFKRTLQETLSASLSCLSFATGFFFVGYTVAGDPDPVIERRPGWCN